MTEITSIYSDGGVIGRNPSPYGGTWAWRAVDKEGKLVTSDSGLYAVPATTNNLTEFLAALHALEALPDGWGGELRSDSQVTLGRFCYGWALRGLPLDIVKRGGIVLRRLGRIEPVLLQGHPTRRELAEGVGRRHGYPVSWHNVLCDMECGRLAREYMAGRLPGRVSRCG